MKTKTETKIRVRLESFNHELLTLSCRKLLSILKDSSLTSFGVIPLPTCKRVYCVLRSPHVNKDSREHFEIRIHRRVLDIYYDPEVPVFDFLSKVDLPAGIFYRICLS